MTLPPDKLSYTIREFSLATGLKRTAIYGAMRSKLLAARKRGKTTIITHEDGVAYLSSLPHWTPRSDRSTANEDTEK